MDDINEFNNSILNTDVGYVINPFQKMDGLMSQDFYLYLANAQDGDVVKYPKIIEDMYLGWFKYVTKKQFNIKYI
jgi:hypothetical protein